MYASYFKSKVKKLVMILQENIALSGASRMESLGLRNESQEARDGHQTRP